MRPSQRGSYGSIDFRAMSSARPYGAALFVSRPSKVPFIENKISLIEFAREKVA